MWILRGCLVRVLAFIVVAVLVVLVVMNLDKILDFIERVSLMITGGG